MKKVILADLIAMEQKARKSGLDRHWNEFVRGVHIYVAQQKEASNSQDSGYYTPSGIKIGGSK